MKVHRFYETLFIFFMMSFTTYSQTSELISTTENWSLAYQKDGVDFYVRYENCYFPNQKEPVVFAYMKLVNKNLKSVKISCDFGTVFTEACVDCQNGEYPITTVLEPSSEMEGSCENRIPSLTRVIVNKNLKGGYEYRGVQLFNVKITK